MKNELENGGIYKGAYITKIQLEVIHTPPEQVDKLLMKGWFG